MSFIVLISTDTQFNSLRKGYGTIYTEILGGDKMADKHKEPHEQMTDKNNNLSAAQEVTYAKDFTKADKAVNQKEEKE